MFVVPLNKKQANLFLLIIHGIYYIVMADKKLPGPHHPKRNIREQTDFKKKLPERLESTPITFQPTLHALPVIVFLEDEARFGKIGRKMACWVKASMTPSVTNQANDSGIYLCLLSSLATNRQLLFNDKPIL